jgi:hypothetical protein
VEGLAGGDDRPHDGIGIAKDIARCKPDGAKAEGEQSIVSTPVACHCVAALVDLAIDFDRHPCREAGEVHYV